MINLEKELASWKELLDSGEIDEETFKIETEKITQKYNHQLEKEKQKIENQKPENKIKVLNKRVTVFYVLLWILFFTIAILVGQYIVENYVGIRKYETVENLSNLSEPIQIPTTGQIILEDSGNTHTMLLRAEYSISGRVVNIQNYMPNTPINKISPLDFGISWGFLASNEHYQNISWYSRSNRTLYHYSNNSSWLESVGGEKNISTYFSHNHLVPENEKIKNLLSLVETNDFIKIDGYLIDVNTVNADGSTGYWYGSTIRTDHGCEIIYVTAITWLKE